VQARREAPLRRDACRMREGPSRGAAPPVGALFPERRESVHGGSASASLPRTVRKETPPDGTSPGRAFARRSRLRGSRASRRVAWLDVLRDAAAEHLRFASDSRRVSGGGTNREIERRRGDCVSATSTARARATDERLPTGALDRAFMSGTAQASGGCGGGDCRDRARQGRRARSLHGRIHGVPGSPLPASIAFSTKPIAHESPLAKMIASQRRIRPRCHCVGSISRRSRSRDTASCRRRRTG
jgi:hypothetical protein